MAIVLAGGVTRMTKSVGDITYRQVKSRTVASAHVPRIQKISGTPIQLKNRATFGQVAKFTSRQRPVIKQSFEETKTGWAFNQYMKQNYQFLADVVSADLSEAENLKNVINKVAQGSYKLFGSYGRGQFRPIKCTLVGGSGSTPPTSISVEMSYNHQIDSIFQIVSSVSIVAVPKSDGVVEVRASTPVEIITSGGFVNTVMDSVTIEDNKLSFSLPMSAYPSFYDGYDFATASIMITFAVIQNQSKAINKSYAIALVDGGVVDGGGTGGGDGVIEI